MDNLTQRATTILAAVIREYICTGEPVSSKAMAVKCGLALSPASIRKTMSELEQLGFLVQPHTSAGRVPTEKSFRFYVDSLLKVEELVRGDKEIISSLCDGAASVEGALREASKALSMLTRCAVMVLASRGKDFIIKSIRVVKVDRLTVMVIVVSDHGVVHTKPLRMKEAEIGRLDFERISNYLNSRAPGLTFEGLRRRITEDMRGEKSLYDGLLANALKLSSFAMEKTDGGAERICYVEGKTNILDQPEFRVDFKRMKRIFNVFEEKSLLVKILDSFMEGRGINVVLGSESKIEDFEGLSFVTTPYGIEGEFKGTLGVVGPVWMNYPKIIPLVGYTAGVLGKRLTNITEVN